MSSLARERRVFHSESDFQFAFGWQVKTLYPNALVFFEKPATLRPPGSTFYVELDLLVVLEGTKTAIEMKYPKAEWRGVDAGVEFNLPGGSPRDLQLRLFAEDLARVEQLVAQGDVDHGHAIMLTNFALMWSDCRPNTQFSEFVLTDGRRLPSQLNWAGDPQNKYSVALRGSHTVAWTPFSDLPGTKFRYLSLDA